MRALAYAITIMVGITLVVLGTSMGATPAAWVLYLLGAMMVGTAIVTGVARA